MISFVLLLHNFFSSPTEEATKRIHRRSFSANLILLLGYIFGVWFQIYEFNGRDRELIAVTVYFLTFSLLVISGIAELSVDIFSIRTVGHGRYHSDSPLWNRAISLLFICMGILDIMAFCFWIYRDFRTENILLICSGYVLLIMTILVLFFQLKESITGTPDKLDLAGNGLVFVCALPNIVLRHVEDVNENFFEMTRRWDLAIVIVYLISAVLYVSADVIRVKYIGDMQLQSTQISTPTQQPGYDDDDDDVETASTTQKETLTTNNLTGQTQPSSAETPNKQSVDAPPSSFPTEESTTPPMQSSEGQR